MTASLAELVSEVQEIMVVSDAMAERTVSSMISITKDYIEGCNLKSLVIGISGGLDSAVVAAILQEKNTGVPLIGISIPLNSSNEHREQARWVGENFCTAFEECRGWEVPVNDYDEELYDYIESAIFDTHTLANKAGFGDFPTGILQGNIKARLRMMTLYDLARKTNGMVLSTDNLSEYMAGFWTVNGDVGDWGIIQNVWKGFELPQIARYVGVREDIITQKPSDGLSVTKDDTDEAQLGMTYQEFDTIISIYTRQLNVDEKTLERLFKILQINTTKESKIDMAVNRYINTQFKRTGTINLTREEICL